MKIAFGIGLAIFLVGLVSAFWFMTRPGNNEDSLAYAVGEVMISFAVAAVGAVILIVTGFVWFVA